MLRLKVMPLLLTVMTPFVLAPRAASAGDVPIVLAQAQTPQQKEEERKKHEQQQQQQHHAQEPQKAAPPKPKELPHKAQETPKPQPPKQAEPGKPHEPEHRAQEQHLAPHAPAATVPGQREPEHRAQDQHPAPHAPGAAAPGFGQTSVQPHQQQKPVVQQQQAAHPQLALRPVHSAQDQKAKAERDAHHANQQRLITQQRQNTAAERSPAALNERLKLQNERMKVISSQRTQSVDRHGQTVFKEPGNRTIFQANGRAFIHTDESAKFKLFGGNPQTRRGPDGVMISTFARPGGARLEVEVDSFGRPLRRVRILPDGRRFVLFRNTVIGVGVGFAIGAFIVELARPRIDIPQEQYIVDASVAPEETIYGALQAGPVEPLDRGYSLDEILASISLRERMRSISIDTINFEFGSSEVGPDQAQMLEGVAAVMRDMTTQNPGEVFLIEGHTDAVGSDVDNLSLSDRRAQAVSEVFAQQFNVPAENLVTQGYGKQFLLIPTDEPERRNRRVVVRRITPLLATDAGQVSDAGPGDQDPGDQGPGDRR